ncbi:hypothetical protein [Phenylobacterium sp.]|uniref:hypothetical protein n=1 Tax=Phenylobacterium sp. TaxID=1871053 RepID=UPI002DF456D0|nr:hypothetical protein [Phenylobacterium sp.]
MSLLVALAVAAIQLRPDPPPLSLAQARGLTPAGLADLLLAPGHPRVVEALVGQDGMQPPPPPGQGAVTLYTEARPSDRPGFCERIVAYVQLKATATTAGGGASDFTPANIAWRAAYRWAGAKPTAQACDAPRSDFFSPEPAEPDRALATVRLLASAQARSERPGALPFEVSVDDREAPQMQTFARAHPEVPSRYTMKTITDGKAALRGLPLGQVRGVFRPEQGRRDLLTPSDLADIERGRLAAQSLFVSSDWTATLLLDGDRIVRIRLRREIPPPF